MDDNLNPLCISVVIVNYNAGQTLVDCIESALPQVTEVLVVDNASSDRSLELCASPPAILNVAGPERISVRDSAEWFGSQFGRAAVRLRLCGNEATSSGSASCRSLEKSSMAFAATCAVS